ncbi:MAG: hypothetical protein ACKVHO_05150 [Verrucomicrobiia bacterium]|jgi:hypothetical protein
MNEDMMEAKPVSKTLLVVSCILLAIVTRTWVSGQATQSEKDRQEFWVRAKFWQIERLLLLYHEEHGAFSPTKYQADPDGPLHSWRVLLVPHAGKSFKERFSNYDFDQEWNSLTNHHALYEMPGFNFFGMEEGNASLADFLAISGTNWPVERAQLKRPLPTYLVTKGEDRFLLVYDLNTMEHQK